MLRYLGPLLLILGGAWVYHHNGTSDASVVVLWGTHLVPGYETDRIAQGQLSWQLLLGIGALLAGWRFSADLRRRRESGGDEEGG